MIVRWRIPDDWRREFLVHARRHHVPKRHIAEALADVEAHCSDSGQSPAEAFGDPSAYAEALARELRPSGFPPAHLRVGTNAIQAIGTLTGILCLVLGVVAIREGGDAWISHGRWYIFAAVMGVTVAIVAYRLGRLRGYLVWVAILGTAWMAQTPWGLGVFGVVDTGWGWFAIGLFLLALAWFPLMWRHRPLLMIRPVHRS